MKISGINMISNSAFVSNTKQKNLSYSANSTNFSNYENLQFSNSAAIGMMNVKRACGPAAIITFGGTKDKSKAFYIGAELPPYWKVGGVATVMRDYPGPHIIPYYNGKIEYDGRGIPKPDKNATVHRLPDGTPIFIPQDLSVKSAEQAIIDGNYHKLTEVSKQSMLWGMDEKSEIALYKVLPKQADIDKALKNGKEAPKLQEHYMVFTDATAKMPRPYADNSYSFGYDTRLGADIATLQGDAYAKFGKAVVELMPSIKEHNPETVICSDAQTAYVTHYMAVKNLNGDEYYKNMKPSYVKHNVGMGYTGRTTNKNMFVNMVESVDQIKAIKSDPVYIDALRNKKEEEYFAKFVSKTHDAFGYPNATVVALRYHRQDFVGAATTVSEDYGISVATNPMVAPEIYPLEKELYALRKSGGILNGFSDESVSAYKKVPLGSYGDGVTAAINGVEQKYEPMKIFTEGMSLDEMLRVKKENQINLFERLSTVDAPSEVICGLAGKKANLIGVIDPKWVDAVKESLKENKDPLKKVEDVKLFVSWGRGDSQKGLDSVLEAFEKFVKDTKDKNSVLVLGGDLDNANPESAKIRMKVNAMLKDVDIKGRLCYIDGFAPGYALASAAHAAVFPSRFAPCELTDLEAQKYFCTPIVSGTQGLKQKNFDYRNEAERAKATSYKTEHEYQMGVDELKKASPKFAKEYEKILDKERKLLVINQAVVSDIEELAIKNVSTSDVFELLYRECADEVIVDELADAMKAKSVETKEVSELIYENHKKMKAGWADNNNLHPSGKSSNQMYKELHLDPDPQKAKFSLFDAPMSEVNQYYKKKMKLSLPKVVDETATVVKKGLSRGSKIGIGLAAVTAFVAFGVYGSHQRKALSKVNKEGDEFQKSRISA